MARGDPAWEERSPRTWCTTPDCPGVSVGCGDGRVILQAPLKVRLKEITTTTANPKPYIPAGPVGLSRAAHRAGSAALDADDGHQGRHDRARYPEAEAATFPTAAGTSQAGRARPHLGCSPSYLLGVSTRRMEKLLEQWLRTSRFQQLQSQPLRWTRGRFRLTSHRSSTRSSRGQLQWLTLRPGVPFLQRTSGNGSHPN